ncbi:non-ribosomal peptide synthetase modules and related proteins [Moorella thermoacetica Y72]|uniref:Non-ribosomal peptide synthetase modules and related proteins n=1 Tax=Moorella thermoacetica Y72 TaxID=1325331 RepID=A0A0S6UB60_NEOTH|nr:non-ribosomal peptide synthetase modules and related proteins [Moorella thermoacetica Y72]
MQKVFCQHFNKMSIRAGYLKCHRSLEGDITIFDFLYPSQQAGKNKQPDSPATRSIPLIM